jgi:hypothetical protein
MDDAEEEEEELEAEASGTLVSSVVIVVGVHVLL